MATAFFPGQLRQCDSQDTVAKLSPDLFAIDGHGQAQAADEVTSATLAAVKVPFSRDALKRSLALQDEVSLFDCHRYLLFLNPRKISFENESGIGFVEIKLGTPLFYARTAESPGAMDQFVE